MALACHGAVAGAQMPVASSMRWYFQAIGLNVLLPGAVVGGDVYRAIALQKTGQAKAASNLGDSR